MNASAVKLAEARSVVRLLMGPEFGAGSVC